MIPVTAAIIIRDQKVLAVRRAPHKHMGGYWEFPGGKVEPNETPEECLVRELAEELDITIQVAEHLASNEHDYGDRRIMLMAYRCHWVRGDIQLNDHDAMTWCRAGDLSLLDWAPADIPIVEVLLAKMTVANNSADKP